MGLGVFVLLLSLLGFFEVRAAEKKESEPFRARKSMVDTAERLMTSEPNPYKKFQLLLRWIKYKEEYEQDQALKTANPEPGFRKLKDEIILRIQQEIARFDGIKNVDPSVLHRELGYRYLELKLYDQSQTHFFKILNRLPDDEMAIGDGMMGSSQVMLALEFYDKAAKDAKLRPVIMYKRAWAYMQLARFADSLREFDTLISEVEIKGKPGQELTQETYDGGRTQARPLTKLREEAYRDRLRPYVETFSSPNFIEQHVQELKTLAAKVFPEDKNAQVKIYAENLKSLVEAFNAKAQVGRAEEVFQAFAKEFRDSEALLISSAPLWLKTYRGLLDHTSLERVVNNLPEKNLKKEDNGVLALQAELHNTAAFYETLVGETGKADIEMSAKNSLTADSVADFHRARKLLMVVYFKYFQIFSTDPDSDPLRVNFAKLLFEDGDAIQCLSLLSGRSKNDVEVEKVAANLEARCELKELDQLYAKPHHDEFYTKLHSALAGKKIYQQKDLGVNPEQAFESLGRMLMGSLQKNMQSQKLRETLKAVVESYPFAKTASLFRELQIVQAELRFEDLVASTAGSDQKADGFFEIHQKAPPSANVAKKALLNSVMIDVRPAALDRCDKFIQIYPEEFRAGNEVFKRCVGLSENHLDIDHQYRFLKNQEKALDERDTIRLAYIELARSRPEGMQRLRRLNTELAKRAMASWEGPAARPERRESKQFEKLQENTLEFVRALKPIGVQQIAKMVPQTVKDFHWIDRIWLKYYQSESEPYYLARTLERRAFMAAKMRDWMKALPEPKGLSKEELEEYRKKAEEVVKPWDERAAIAIKDCEETAYVLSVDYKEKEGTVCKENSKPTFLQEHLDRWNKTRQWAQKTWPWGKDKNENQVLLEKFLEGGKAASEKKDWLLTRYFLVRALDFAENNREKAHVYLQLARMRKSEEYWLMAAQLDGNLPEPVEHFLEQAKGNPFYERLYKIALDYIRKGEQVSDKHGSSMAQRNP